MSILKALIFDVDGTLAETERDGHRLAFNRALREAGFDLDWSVALYGELLEVAGGKERLRFYFDRYCPDVQVTDETIARLHATKTEYYREILASGTIPLRPGVKRLINEAREAGLRLAIATTSAYPNAIALLEKTLNPDWFEAIAAGDIVAAKKPAPDIYFYVLEQLGLTATDCLVFEDSQAGLEAATQAGLKTIVTVNNYTENQNFAGALLVLNNLGEPDHPCQVLAGVSLPFPYVNLEAIKGLF